MRYLAYLLRLKGRRPVAPTPVAVMDPLEPRALLTTTMSPEGVVTVTGTDGPDALTVRLNLGGNDVQVVGDGPGIFGFNLAVVTAVKVNGLGGDDTLTVDTGSGLVSRADLPFTITFDGGAGNDGLSLTGAPAGVSVDETITFGPAAGAGKVESRGGGRTQSVAFAGVESVLDTMAAVSLTVRLGDGANLVEVGNGPTLAGVTTATLRAFDVTACEVHTAVAPPGSAAAGGTTAPAASAAVTEAPIAVSKGKRGKADAKASARAEREAQRDAKRDAKRRAKELKAAAKAAARAAKRAQKEAERAARAGTDAPAVPAPPPTFAPAVQELVVGVAHVPVQFANKAAVTLDTAGGDDWASVNLTAPPAGLKSLALRAGDGQDHAGVVAVAPGVAWSQEGAEAVTSTVDYVTVDECTEVPPPSTDPGPAEPLPTGGNDDADKGKDKNKDKNKDKGDEAADEDDDDNDDDDNSGHGPGHDEQDDDGDHDHDDDGDEDDDE